MHTHIRTRAHRHAQSYVENCKVWSSSPLSPPSHNKVKWNGTSPWRLTFPRLSCFAYPKYILLLVVRGSANWERQGSWRATAQGSLCCNLCCTAYRFEEGEMLFTPCMSQLLAQSAGKFMFGGWYFFPPPLHPNTNCSCFIMKVSKVQDFNLSCQSKVMEELESLTLLLFCVLSKALSGGMFQQEWGRKDQGQSN